ncbi:MAG: HAMP domain-containing protein [Chthoniobacter sp.]|nr:HAMP domain-containing protein [Chthoniobacter sp.]
MKRLSLRVRLGVWSVLMLAIPLVIFGCVVAVSVYYSEVESTERELRVESAAVLGRMLDARRTGRDPEEVRALIEPFHPYLEVLDESGKAIYRSVALQGVPIVTEPRESGNVRTLSIGDTLVQQATASSDGLTVSLGASLARPRAKLRQLLRGYGVAAPFLLTAFAFGAAWVARHALQPIEEITARAEQISAASLDARLPVPAAKDELRRLTEVLNGMMARLEGSFQQVARFTSDASHELRTPLAILRAELETALQTDAPPEARASRVHGMLDEVHRLSSLVDSLLLLSRSDAGRLELDLQPVDLSRMVEAAADDARLLGDALHLTVESALPKDVTVRADAARLRQVLLNLVDNAVKFNRRDGRLRIALAVGETDVRLTVGNTGTTLGADHRRRIFERFFRGDSARSREIKGFGLGLSISREIMLAHGGRLELSQSEEDWTEFSAILPLPPQRATRESPLIADSKKSPRLLARFGDAAPD